MSHQAAADYDSVLRFILETLESFKNDNEVDIQVSIDKDVSLIGDGAIIDSRSLVVLLIAVEDFLDEEYGAQFDWSSDKAMSGKSSPFRTPTTLAEFAVQEANL